MSTERQQQQGQTSRRWESWVFCASAKPCTETAAAAAIWQGCARLCLAQLACWPGNLSLDCDSCQRPLRALPSSSCRPVHALGTGSGRALRELELSCCASKAQQHSLQSLTASLSHMPCYRLFCLARPGLALQEQAAVIRSAATAVLDGGGVLMDLQSYGEKPLAYPVRPAGQRFDEVRDRRSTALSWPPCLVCVTSGLCAGPHVAALLPQPPQGAAAAVPWPQGDLLLFAPSALGASVSVQACGKPCEASC